MNATIPIMISGSPAAGGRGKEGANAAGKKGETFSDAMAAATTGDEQEAFAGKEPNSLMLPFTMPAMVMVEPVAVSPDSGAATAAGAMTGDEPSAAVTVIPVQAEGEKLQAGQKTVRTDTAQIPPDNIEAEAALPDLQADYNASKTAASDEGLTTAVKQGGGKAAAISASPLQEMLTADGSEEPVTLVNAAGQMPRKDQTAPVQAKTAAPLQGDAGKQATVAEPVAEQPEVNAAPVVDNKAVATGEKPAKSAYDNFNPDSKASLTDTDGQAEQPVKNVFAELLQQRTVQAEPKAYATEAKNAATQFVKDTHNITSQIVDQAQVLKNNQETQMIIRLKPEHLGELTLKVTVDKGVINASFHSDNAEVRTVIEASLQHLKQELSSQGLKVDNVGVYAGLGQFLSNGQREAPQQPAVKFKHKLSGEEAFEEAEALLSNQAVSDDGVDYRI